MRQGTHRYGSPAAVESAIKAAAQSAHAEDPSVSVQDRIRQEHFRRFLSRVFSEGEDSQWVLKGGTNILTRVVTARPTTDLDLLWDGPELDDALAELRRLAGVDLGDHFRYAYAGHRRITGGTQQSQLTGCSVSFDAYLGAKHLGAFRVDLVIGTSATATVRAMHPDGALALPSLVSHPYRLYPLADQIADKVCATLASYGGGPSSREHDLVDIVVLAATHKVDAVALARALRTEASRRGLELPTSFEVPAAWGSAYERAAQEVPACDPFRKIAAAKALARSLLDPVLTGAVSEGHWSPTALQWVPVGAE